MINHNDKSYRMMPSKAVQPDLVKDFCSLKSGCDWDPILQLLDLGVKIEKPIGTGLSCPPKKL